MALVSPSGSGKSTILRAGRHLPAARERSPWAPRPGSIRREASRSRRANASVGFVFHFALFPHLTAQENVMQAMGPVPGGERRERALRPLERTNLAGLEDRRPARLSGDQQRRVAVARALARDPKGAAAREEPFSGHRPDHPRKCRGTGDAAPRAQHPDRAGHPRARRGGGAGRPDVDPIAARRLRAGETGAADPAPGVAAGRPADRPQEHLRRRVIAHDAVRAGS
ncbi:MAG: amino acid ABC transporter ATP-binding protein [Betaproteobacteria bacterium]|nr:amino acid ABC transporter ATP-binding protein [Betaproteobacteria bacterium]